MNLSPYSNRPQQAEEHAPVSAPIPARIHALVRVHADIIEAITPAPVSEENAASSDSVALMPEKS